MIRRRRWGRHDPAEWPADAAPTWSFRRAAGIAMLCVVAGLALGRADVVAIGLPFALYAAVAWGRAATPRLDVALRASRDRLFEGETTTASVDLASDVDLDAVVVAFDVPYGLVPVDPRPRIVAVRAGVPRTVDVELQAVRWGRWSMGPVRVTPFGPHLGSGTAPRELPAAKVAVLSTGDAFRAADLTPQALATSGAHRSRRRGEGLEFHGVRPFAYGDRLRRINWRVSARHGDLYVNETVTDRMAEVVVLVDSAFDAGRSGGYFGRASSLDVSVRAAGAIATHYLYAGDSVSLVEFGGRIRDLSGLHGRGAATRALDWLLDVTPGTLGWDVQARRIGAQLLPARALAVVLSPLLENRCVELLADLRQRGQAIVVVDTLPRDALPEPTRFTEEMAHRIWWMERDRTVAQLGEVGVPVVAWSGSGSIDPVLRDVVRVSRAPRLVLR